MKSPRMVWRAIKRLFESAERTYTIVGVLIGAATIAAPYALDFVLDPEYQIVYTFERYNNPVAAARERIRRIVAQQAEVSRKKYLPPPTEEQRFKEHWDLQNQLAQRVVDVDLAREIDGDQVHVWALNVGRHRLENVTFTFLNCPGYINHVAEPVSQAIAQKPSANPEVSANGLVYYYGTLQQGSEIFLKAGFEELGNCAVAIDAQLKDKYGTATRGKWVTGDDYNEFKAKLGDERTRSVLNGALLIVGLLLAATLIWSGVVYSALKRRVATLESHVPARSETPITDKG